MELVVGAIVEGKVTGITKFGAFITMPGGSSGLVHISEIANAYVNDIHDYLTMGQSVEVKVLSITPEGKVNLSIKQAQPQPTRENTAPRSSAPPRPAPPRPAPQQSAAPQPRGPGDYASAAQGVVHGPTGDASFEDKLKHFMQDSESRMADIRRNTDKKNGSRRRK